MSFRSFFLRKVGYAVKEGAFMDEQLKGVIFPKVEKIKIIK